LPDGRGFVIGVTLHADRAQYDAGKAEFQQKGFTVQDVSGIGDAAYSVTQSGGSLVMVFLKGSNVASIGLSKVAGDPAATLNSLGSTAAARL
jgi:hypothetical protein